MKITEIARNTIKETFDEKEYYPGETTENKYSDKKASFITLTKNGKLRGCIGSLEAKQPLWQDIIQNAIGAAFHDPRFEPLKEKELNEIKIEVSILSEPKKIEVKHSKFIPEKITREMGVILKSGQRQATFLPQVWEEIHNKEDFLESLSEKAGLDKDGWKNAEIYSYTVEKIKE